MMPRTNPHGMWETYGGTVSSGGGTCGHPNATKGNPMTLFPKPDGFGTLDMVTELAAVDEPAAAVDEPAAAVDEPAADWRDEPSHFWTVTNSAGDVAGLVFAFSESGARYGAEHHYGAGEYTFQRITQGENVDRIQAARAAAPAEIITAYDVLSRTLPVTTLPETDQRMADVLRTLVSLRGGLAIGKPSRILDDVAWDLEQIASTLRAQAEAARKEGR